MENTYVCPFCLTEYDADEGEELDFEDWECPQCGIDINFNGSEKI